MQPLKNTGRILIDANVLLRFLLNDNEKQANEAKEVISGGSCVLLPEVLAEVVYVLSKVYGIDRDDISASIKKVLSRMHIDNYPVMDKALDNYEFKKLDFVDCILLAHNRTENSSVFTFDKELGKKLAGEKS